MIAVVLTGVVLVGTVIAAAVIHLGPETGNDSRPTESVPGPIMTETPPWLGTSPAPSSSPARPGNLPLEGRVAWSKPAHLGPGSVPAHNAPITGGWFAPGAVIRMGGGQLVAYRSADGKELWRLRPPAVGNGPGRFCTMSRSAVGNVGAVLFGVPGRRDPARCAWLALVDLRTGKIRWTAKLDLQPILPLEGQVEIAGGRVVVNQAAKFAAYSASTGTRLWRRDWAPDGRCSINDLMATARRIVAVAGCRETPHVGFFDPANGRLVASNRISTAGRADQFVHVAAADPAVLIQSGVQPTGRFLVLDSKAGLSFGIPLTGTYGRLSDGIDITSPVAQGPIGYGASWSRPVVTGEGLLILETQAIDPRQPNRLAAFDLATRRLRWVSPVAPTAAVPVAVTRTGVIAASTGTVVDPPQLYRLNLRDGRPTALGPPYPVREVNLLTKKLLSWTGSGIDAIDLYPPAEAAAFALR